MGKRVFVGIPASEGVVKAVWEWRQKNIGLPVRWLKEKNLHLTLVPPFESQDIAKVAEKLATVRFSAFELEFQKVGLGPDPRALRLIWAQGTPIAALSELRIRIFAALGQKPDARVFKPHITLARFRLEESPGMDMKAIAENLLWSMMAGKLVLYESILGRAGAEYEVLTEFNSR